MHTRQHLLRAHTNIRTGAEKMRQTTMPTNVRLTQGEQEALRRKAVEINKELVKRGLQPMKDSELVHAFLEQAINALELTASGAVVICKE